MPASVLISSVFARPGTPVIRQWPPVNSAIRTCSITSSCPTITFRSSARIRTRPWATFSGLTVVATSMCLLMCEGVYDLVDAHAIRERGVFNVAGVLFDVRPLPPVAHVGVPVDPHHRPAGVVENRPQMRDVPALLLGSPG